jgi:hypothetical protein
VRELNIIKVLKSKRAHFKIKNRKIFRQCRVEMGVKWEKKRVEVFPLSLLHFDDFRLVKCTLFLFYSSLVVILLENDLVDGRLVAKGLYAKVAAPIAKKDGIIDEVCFRDRRLFVCAIFREIHFENRNFVGKFTQKPQPFGRRVQRRLQTVEMETAVTVIAKLNKMAKYRGKKIKY